MGKQKSKENKKELSFREKELIEFLVEVSIYFSKKDEKGRTNSSSKKD